MWNLFPFYLDLTVVYATHGCLENLDHFLCRPTGSAGMPSIFDALSAPSINSLSMRIRRTPASEQNASLIGSWRFLIAASNCAAWHGLSRAFNAMLLASA
jgi:hypothetical protein